MSPLARRWAVVGAGMLGLTLAKRLAEAGNEVTLIEGSSVLGGLAAPWQLGDLYWDRHYHVTLLSDLHTRGILRELDLEAGMRWVTTGTGLYARGRLHPLSSSLDYLRLPSLGPIEKARLAATILWAARITDWQTLEHIPVGDWLVRLSGRATFEKLWLPLLRAKLGEGWRDTSAAFIWATIQRLYAARRSGMKREMFGYVPGGYAAILARFAERLGREGVDVRVGTPVKRVTRADGGVEIALGDGHTEFFERAVLTLTPRVAARLCDGLEPEEYAQLRGIRYQGIVCASLLFDQPLSPYYLTYLTDSDWPFTAVVEMSAFVDRAQFAGKTLVYLPCYASGDDPVFELSDAALEESFTRALGRIHPSFARERMSAFRVSRVREVFPVPTLGYSTRLPPPATSIRGLYTISSAHIVNGTLNVNDTVNLAERAARALVAADGGPISLLPGSVEP